MTYPLTYVYLACFVAVTIVFAIVAVATPPQASKRSLVTAGYSVALWALADALSNLATTPEQMQVISWVFCFVWAPVPFWLLRSALLYAGHRAIARSVPLTLLLLVPAGGCIWLTFSGWLYTEFLPASANGYYFESRATFWQHLIIAYFGSYIGAACVVLIQAARRQGRRALRTTGRLLSWGLAPVVVAGAVVNGGLSPLGLNPPYLGTVFGSVFCVFAAIGVLRQDLFAPLQVVRQERDRALDDLSRREEVLAIIPAGVGIVEPSSGEIYYHNRLFGELLGAGELRTLPPAVAAVARTSGDALEHPELAWPPEGEGARRTLTVHARPVSYAGHDALLVGLQDVTERKVMEREIHEQREQLLQAQKMEAMGRLAAGVAHDFKNQLTVILTNAQSAQQVLEPGHPVQEDLADILQAAEAGTGLTRQLLAFSRKQTARPEVLDVNVVLEEQARLLRRVLGSEVRLRVDAAPEPCWVWMDCLQLDQVLMALATNSRDAMPSGGELRFAVRRQAALDSDGVERERVVVTCADTGMGMPQDVLERAFEPFFSTKGQHGTGLGLATAYGIVSQAGGTISIQSEPGRGTTFTLSFPAADAAAAEQREPESGPVPRVVVGSG